MNKKIINQALKFEDEMPTYSQVKDLCLLATEYQMENSVHFLQAKRGTKTLLKDKTLFFIFISQTQGVNVDDFEDLRKLLNPKSRAENIEYSGNSKNSYVAVFDGTVLVKKRGELAELYQVDDLAKLENIEDFIAIENGETFLKSDKYIKYFQAEHFIYLSGYANSLTRKFLSTKNVIFFVDFDIEGMNIYESFTCKNKHLHIPNDLKRYFLSEKYHNVELYKKQRARLKDNYSCETTPVISLIKEYHTVVEQEIIYEAS
ncbi:MAG: hypothetical protein QM497_07900 [Sulfurimonas sp.]